MNNVKPLDRYERNSLQNKDKIEQAYINKRSGYEARDIDAQRLLYASNVKSSLYCPENERFDKDFSIKDRFKRQEDFQRMQNIRERKRYEYLNRQSQQWEKYTQKDSQEQQRIQLKSDRIFQNRRNVNYEGYNPINQMYDRNAFGQSLQMNEQNKMVNYLVRQSGLNERINSNYNILTGEMRNSIIVPVELKDKFEQKNTQYKEFYKGFNSQR